MPKRQLIRTFISVKPIQSLYFLIQIMLFNNLVLDSLKSVSRMIKFLKQTLGLSLRKRFFLTQTSMLIEVYACYSYKRHIDIFTCIFVTAWSTISGTTI